MPSKVIAEQVAKSVNRSFALAYRLEQQLKDVTRRLELARQDLGKQQHAATMQGVELTQDMNTGIYQLVPPVYGWDEDQPK